ncbi:MAG: DUF4230 domain-containing protein [Rhodothermia bacterium]|nr:DUF4230 domain-containing protein [Rhodothermia bacterium]
MTSYLQKAWRTVAGLLLVVIAVSAALWLARPRFSETEVRQRIVTAIQTESASSFYVTGELEITATASVQNTRYLIPPLRLNLGTTSATVRLPGRVTYGFDVRELTPEHVAVDPNGDITVTIPELAINSVEADLELMEVQTDVGWARTYAGSGQEVTREAMSQAHDILRQQGAAHLRDNSQPRINTAKALQVMLTPVLQAVGIAEPRFTFQVGTNLVMESEL